MEHYGIDVDGILTKQEEYQLKYGKKYFSDKNNIDETKYDIKEIFNCSKQERDKFWLIHIWRYCLIEKLDEETVEYVKQLKTKGKKIHIITGRAHTTEKNFRGALFRAMLLFKLKISGVPYDTIDFCSEENSANEKVQLCLHRGVQIMLEDKKENILAISKIAKVIGKTTKSNQEIYNGNVIMTSNVEEMQEADKVFNEMEENIQVSVPKCDMEVDKKEFSETINIEDIKMSSDTMKHDNNTREEIEKWKNYREYLQTLPFNHEEINKQEKNYEALAKVGIPCLNKFFDIAVFGKENIDNIGKGVLFICNHENYYDQFPLIAAIGTRPIHFLVSTKMLNMKRGVIYKKTGAISVDREDEVDRKQASETTSKYLVHDKDVFMFPEGRTNRKHEFLMEFKPGAMAIARKTGATVVPIALDNNYKDGSGQMCVRFGTPFKVDITDDVIEKTEYSKEQIAYLKQQNINYKRDKIESQNEKGKVKKK